MKAPNTNCNMHENITDVESPQCQGGVRAASALYYPDDPNDPACDDIFLFQNGTKTLLLTWNAALINLLYCSMKNPNSVQWRLSSVNDFLESPLCLVFLWRPNPLGLKTATVPNRLPIPHPFPHRQNHLSILTSVVFFFSFDFDQNQL